MSEKELAIELINRMPEYKLGYAIAYLQGLSADENSDDEFCRSLIEKYESDADKGNFVSFEEAAGMCGVEINAVQN